MNSKHINSGSAMKIMLEEEITTMPDPWRCWVLTVPICIPAGSVQEGCSGMAECNTENGSKGMHENRAAFTPWDRSCSVTVWLYFHLLWEKSHLQETCCSFFCLQKRTKCPTKEMHIVKSRGKKTRLSLQSMSTPSGHSRVHVTLTSTTLKREKTSRMSHTMGMDGCPLPLLLGAPFSKQVWESSPGRSPAQRETLKLSYCILHLLLNISWYHIQLCLKQSSLPSLILMRPTITPDRAELLQIWNCAWRAASANSGRKILHRLKVIMHSLEWLVVVLPLTEPELWHKEGQDFTLFPL